MDLPHDDDDRAAAAVAMKLLLSCDDAGRSMHSSPSLLDMNRFSILIFTSRSRVWFGGLFGAHVWEGSTILSTMHRHRAPRGHHGCSVFFLQLAR